MPEQEPQVRVDNFREVPLGYTPEQAQEEASRCLQCKKPFCIEGCPVNVDIPGFVRLIAEGHFAEAAAEDQADQLPAGGVRPCLPAGEPVRGAVHPGQEGRAVAIGRLERFAADYEREHGLVEIAANRPAHRQTRGRGRLRARPG